MLRPCSSLSQGIHVPFTVTGPSRQLLLVPNTPLQAQRTPLPSGLNPDSRNAGCRPCYWALRGETEERLPHPPCSMASQNLSLAMLPPPCSFPGSRRHPFAPSLHHKASEKKNPCHCSRRVSLPLAWPCLSLSKTRAQQFSRTAAPPPPPSLPPKILPPPHHAQGVLSENKKGSAAKASLTDTDLRLEIPLERLSGRPGAGPALDGEQATCIRILLTPLLFCGAGPLGQAASPPKGCSVPSWHQKSLVKEVKS